MVAVVIHDSYESNVERNQIEFDSFQIHHLKRYANLAYEDCYYPSLLGWSMRHPR